MVFDWFRRTTAEAQTQSGAEPSSVPQGPSGDGEPSLTPESAGSPPLAPEAADKADQAATSPEPAGTPPAIGAVDEAALEWARQAYARLKAQQQSPLVAATPAEPAAGSAPPEPSLQRQGSAAGEAVAPSPPPASAPEPVAPGSSSAQAAASLAPLDSAVAVQSPASSTLAEAAAPAPTQGPAPEPPASQLPSSSLPPQTDGQDQGSPSSVAASPSAGTPAGEGTGLSLLERAAAQRQQRLQELSSAAPVTEPVPAAATTTPAAPLEAPAAPLSPPADDAAEPSLGDFDATFTWSAEVLAAQGRRVEEISLEEIDWLGRLRQGLEKTRRNFVSQLLENLGDDPLTPEVLDDLETTLLRADVGVQATDQVLEALRRRLNEEVVDPAEGLRFLKQQLRDLLEAPISASQSPLLVPQRGRLNVWLMVGVNGVGKTTTLGKLANLAVRSGYSCLIAAADTFRAAAVQQVSVWGERSGVPVIANPSANADPAAVVYDAIGAARSKGTELVLVDTAGRLQTKHNLMEELSKVRRIIDKLAPEAVVESLLVLDASQGQNGLRQAMAFASAAGLTGVVITKLDGSARGGVALAVASEAGLPIRFIGAGEGIRDLRPFNSFEFVEALLAGSR